MNSLAILDVVTSMNVHQVTQLDAQVVAGNCGTSIKYRLYLKMIHTFVYLDLSLVYGIRTETNKNLTPVRKSGAVS